MRLSFLPVVRAADVTAVTPAFLKSRGVRLLMLDFDNTIVPYTTNVPTEAVERWLRQLLESDITVCVVSNSKRDRVKLFCGQYGLACITHARKPFSKGIKACLDRFGIPASQAALVGDQIFTDTLGANCCGVQSILVEAIHQHNIWLKLRHVAEMPFVWLSSKRKIL